MATHMFCRAARRAAHTLLLAAETAHFDALAALWWDVAGPQRILHKMNLLRMDYIQETVRGGMLLATPLAPGAGPDDVYVPCYSPALLPAPIRENVQREIALKQDWMMSQTAWRTLDVGCGGGILAELMARQPWVEHVTGIDLLSEVLGAARAHAARDPALASKLEYRQGTIDAVEASNFDLVTMFEVLEHVDYPAEVLGQAMSRVRPGGWLFLLTINRDFVSWFTTIAMGEHVLGIVPVGTHLYDKYIDAGEIRQWVQGRGGWTVASARGCIYLPLKGWVFTGREDVGNYMMALRREEVEGAAAA